MTNLKNILLNWGKKLGFEVADEIAASESAWVDVVWFDNRIPFSIMKIRKPKIQLYPVIPVIGFEIERSTVLDVKYLKGTVANLQNLGAMVGVIVIGKEGPEILKKQSPQKYENYSIENLWKELRNKIMHWVHAEAKPHARIVICTEPEIISWAKNVGVVE